MGRPRLTATEWPAAVYAVGDVHGCLTEARRLERTIFADGAHLAGEKWIVYLGDYVDRGPDSAGVLDLLMTRLPPGWQRICLAGNHEIMALDFFTSSRPSEDWLEFGGLETLASYGISPGAIARKSASERKAIIHSHVPSEHLAFLRELPLALTLPGWVFVHAGIRRGVAMADQSEHDLLWIRDDFFNAPADPAETVVHGHTAATAPVVVEGRICVDTGAFATGVLTALRVTAQGPDGFLDTATEAAEGATAAAR